MKRALNVQGPIQSMAVRAHHEIFVIVAYIMSARSHLSLEYRT